VSRRPKHRSRRRAQSTVIFEKLAKNHPSPHSCANPKVRTPALSSTRPRNSMRLRTIEYLSLKGWGLRCQEPVRGSLPARCRADRPTPCWLNSWPAILADLSSHHGESGAAQRVSTHRVNRCCRLTIGWFLPTMSRLRAAATCADAQTRRRRAPCAPHRQLGRTTPRTPGVETGAGPQARLLPRWRRESAQRRCGG